MGNLTRRVVALERSVVPALAQRAMLAGRDDIETLSDDELDRRISVLERLARLEAPVMLHGEPMTPERERAIRDAEREIDWRLRVPADRFVHLTEDELDAAIRSKLAELEATWQAA